jgi:hypothetical protein
MAGPATEGMTRLWAKTCCRWTYFNDAMLVTLPAGRSLRSVPAPVRAQALRQNCRKGCGCFACRSFLDQFRLCCDCNTALPCCCIDGNCMVLAHVLQSDAKMDVL